jgi:phosphate transport system permease protein
MAKGHSKRFNSGVILAIGRIVGETAALIFTSGTNVMKEPTFNLFASQRTLAIHMYMLASEGLPHSKDMAFATGAILIIIVFLVNLATTKLAGRLGRMSDDK